MIHFFKKKPKTEKKGKAVNVGTQFGSPDVKAADTDKVLKDAGLTRSDLSALLFDDAICACVVRRELAVLGNQWHIEGDSTDWLSAEVERLFASLIKNIMRANWLGSSYNEIIWQTVEEGSIGLTISRLEPRKLEKFKQTGKGLVFTNDYGQQVPVVPEKLLKIGINITEINPYGDALLSRVYWAWFNKNFGDRFWSKFAERHASPITVGHFDVAGTDEQAQEDLTKHAIALAGAVSAGIIAVNKDDKITISETSSNGEAHEKFVRHQIKRIQEVMNGRVTVANLTNGSRAAQETDDKFSQQIGRADLALCANGINQVIQHLFNVNGIDGSQVQFVFDREATIDNDRWSRDVALMGTGKIAFTEQYFIDNYAISSDDFELIAGEEKATLSLSKRKLTKGAQEVEDGVQDALEHEPIDDALLIDIIEQATSENDLIRRLALYYDDKDDAGYEQWLSKAISLAEVQGYYHAEKGKF